MTDERMSFTEALSKMIMKGIEGHPEWQLTNAGRIDATRALQEANVRENGGDLYDRHNRQGVAL